MRKTTVSQPHSTQSNQLAGVGLASGSMLSASLGAAVAVPLMTAHGSLGITTMSLACAAVVMMVFVRPRVSRFGAQQWASAGALGLAMGLTTLAFFAAVTLIPLGPATTIDFLGPLTLAAFALRGWSRIALPALAAIGLVAITWDKTGWLLDPLGMAFALAAAAGWAACIVLTRRVGRLFSHHEGLCLSIAAAASLTLPLAFIMKPAELSVAQLPAAAGLALLMPLIPFSFEMMALRRLDMGAFSILMSLEPAIGAVLGFLLLGQTLSLQQTFGILAVVIASVGAVSLTMTRAGTPCRREAL